VELVRGFGLGAHETAGIFSLIYLLAFSAVFTLAAMAAMRKRLIN